MKLYYINSARSFSKKMMGNKITSIIIVFNKLFQTKVIAGKDYVFWKKSVAPAYGNPRLGTDGNLGGNLYFKTSVSELIDIFHDFIIFFNLVFKIKNSDIIWERSNRLHLSGLLISRLKNCLYIFEWKDHLILENSSFFKRYSIFIEKLKLKLSKYIVVESEILKENLISVYNLRSESVYVAHNAVDRNKFYPIPNRKNRDKLVVGYTGSFAFYHNVILFARLICLKEWKDVKFVFIGAGGNENEIKKYISEMNYFNNEVIFLGSYSSDEMNIVYSEIDIAILPGCTDIIAPIKVVEYLSSGLVTIVPSEQSIIEQFCNNSNLQYFLSDNLNSLELVLVDTIYNFDVIKNKAIKNAGVIANKYSWENTWLYTLQLILKNGK
jgi:glycosyltransferase involved in cell wall biosynthesis